MKSAKSWLWIIVVVFVVVFVIFPVDRDEGENQITKTVPVEVKKADINSRLPYSTSVEESDKKPETIGYRIWFDFMNSLVEDGVLANKGAARFARLSGDENTLVVAVVFHVWLPEEPHEMDYGWGKPKENRRVSNIVWKMTIKKGENLTYTLTNIERVTDTAIGLPPVESMEEYRRNAGIEDTSKSIRYEFQDEKLRVSFNGGKKWQDVPVAIDALVGGGTLGWNQQLAEGSYVISPEVTAFVLNGGSRVLVSNDKGENWHEGAIPGQLPTLRLVKLGFTSDKDGYLILTGDKTMSSEAHLVFKTNDGGRSWHLAGWVDNVFSLVTDGGFVDDKLGFISFGEYRYEDNPAVPYLYRTIDGGANWERVEVPIPEQYQGYFTIAEVPTFHGTEGTMLVNQGSSGDYLGGKVLAKYTSHDQGKTWNFAGFVDPDGVLTVD